MNEVTNTTSQPVASSAAVDLVDLHKTLENLWCDALDLQRMSHLLSADLERTLDTRRGRSDQFDGVTLVHQTVGIPADLVGKDTRGGAFDATTVMLQVSNAA